MSGQLALHVDRGTRSATISACGRYRYALERSTGITGPNLAWLMLNPSTANADKDDPTIRKVIGFTRRAGCGVALVVNLFAWRATDPREVASLVNGGSRLAAEGRDNHIAIWQAAHLSDAIVCAWGNEAGRPWVRAQARKVLSDLDAASDLPRHLLCLGRNKDGSPLHPLMPSYDQHPLIPFAP